MIQPSQTTAMERLVHCLSRLPGLGKRSAERMAFHLVKQSEEDVLELAAAMRDLKRTVKHCSTCFNLTEADPCPICGHHERDHSLVMVVEQPNDVAAIETVGAYRGVYHVLMGRLSPLDGVGPGEINTQSLLDRVAEGSIREVILGTNPTLEGDGTAMYLAGRLVDLGVRVTRLARGIPTGANLQMASKAVLSDAIQGRHAMG